ncbi:MAG: hypothetical protein OEW39_02510, partial [Deltaproteobacteria bacterium]|nr:hypothetical protein [Deltaproteobacteria bacterium]
MVTQAFRMFPSAVLALLLAGAPSAVRGQVNFKPLERGDYTEVEERIISVRGLEVGLDYALTLENREYSGLPAGGKGTNHLQDLRLRLQTTLHRDIALHLTLGPNQHNMQNGDLRVEEVRQGSDGRLRDSQPTTLGLRESYLRYGFNPRSFILLGKHELSLGDRQGKIFNAIVPAYTFDCQAGTWCMPFGIGFLGKRAGDAVYHWGLQFNAWDEYANGQQDKLSVEIFRIIYLEQQVPLGKNLGPTNYNPDYSSANPATAPLSSQLLDSKGIPVTYDARKENYYGVRWDFRSGRFYWNGDATGHQGQRLYHSEGTEAVFKVRARAGETELGMRWSTGQAGLRMMTASGDPYEDSSSSASYLRHLRGYHEITPGSYSGTRLYFNGGDSEVDQGAGLGHSISNTRLVGLVLRIGDPENRQVSYNTGLYQLQLNQNILNRQGLPVSKIGLEWDNMLVW